jgi:hypothetical protein
MSDVTLILQAVGRIEKQASEELLPAVYRQRGWTTVVWCFE